MLTGGTDGAAILWRARDGKPLRVLARQGEPCVGVAFASDGRAAVLDKAGLVRLFDSRTGKESMRWQDGGAGKEMAFSRDGRTLAVWGDRPRVHLRDTRTGKPLLPHGGHDAALVGMAFLPGGRLRSADQSGRVIDWDIRTGKPTVLPWPEGAIRGEPLSPDGRWLAVGTRGGAGLADAETGRLRTLDGVRMPQSWAFGTDGKRFAALESKLVCEYRLRVWDAKTWMKLHDHPTIAIEKGLRFSPDGKRLAGMDPEGLSIMDVATGKERELIKLELQGGDWSSDGRFIAVTDSKRIVLWDARREKIARHWKHGGTLPDVVRFSPDARTPGDSGRWHRGMGRGNGQARAAFHR